MEGPWPSVRLEPELKCWATSYSGLPGIPLFLSSGTLSPLLASESRRVSLKHVSGGSSQLRPDYVSRVDLEAARWGRGAAMSPQVC